MRNQTAVQENDVVVERLYQQQEAIELAERTLREQCLQMGELLKEVKGKSTGNHSHCLAELEVLRMVAKGLGNKEIATELNIAEVTVKLHVSHVLEKLSVKDRTQAATVALQRGIISLD